jgi:endonuclease-3
MQQILVDKIFSVLSKDNPHPKTELSYNNNYTLLIAVILSAQSTDVGVNKATKELFKLVDNPKKMLELGEENLKRYINSIGLYNAKAKNIIKLSEILIKDFDSKVPDNLEDLQKLPGVGVKTANVVLNCAFGHNTIAVDTHVFRVANRIGLTKVENIKNAKNVSKTEAELLKIIPLKWQNHAHHWLILHGRYVCVARKPKCQICTIKNFCDFYKKNFFGK